MAVGMTKDASTLYAMFWECGATLLMPLFLVFLPWRVQVGSKCTRPAATWGWQGLGIPTSRTG